MLLTVVVGECSSAKVGKGAPDVLDWLVHVPVPIEIVFPSKSVVVKLHKF